MISEDAPTNSVSTGSVDFNKDGRSKFALNQCFARANGLKSFKTWAEIYAKRTAKLAERKLKRALEKEEKLRALEKEEKV